MLWRSLKVCVNLVSRILPRYWLVPRIHSYRIFLQPEWVPFMAVSLVAVLAIGVVAILVITLVVFGIVMVLRSRKR